MKEHRKAVEYDLLTQTGHDIDDIGRTLSWDALDSFLQFIGPESAIALEADADTAIWSARMKTNYILADIYDMLALINANLVAYSSGKPAKRPNKYPKPGKKKKVENENHFGSGAMPPDELERWMEEKRESHARSSSGDHNSHASDGGRSGKDNE